MPTLSARLPDPLPWPELARPLARAEDALARLDERLRTSPIHDGWIARTHFVDAVAALWLEGELVHIEDLVLHDAGMDIRAPTHELTRAHTVLRSRRRIADAAPGWALSPTGLEALRGRAGESDPKHPQVEYPEPDDDGDETEPAFEPPHVKDGEFAELFASVDAAIAQADRTLGGERRPAAASAGERDPLVYDLRCSARPASAACSPPLCCATAIKPAPICRVWPGAPKPCRANGGEAATPARASSPSSKRSPRRPRRASSSTTVGSSPARCCCANSTAAAPPPGYRN